MFTYIREIPGPRACIRCGYLLRGLDTPRCPECGTAFDPNQKPRQRCATMGLLWMVALAAYPSSVASVAALFVSFELFILPVDGRLATWWVNFMMLLVLQLPALLVVSAVCMAILRSLEMRSMRRVILAGLISGALSSTALPLAKWIGG